MTSHHQQNYLEIIKEIFPHLQNIQAHQLTPEVLDLFDLALMGI
ncbi:MAG: hypothetical protein Q4B71_00345 [Cardiobacteriaceae bacterium]|nr:hypothetical protein [Cardiobacteriaceae bacterium]